MKAPLWHDLDLPKHHGSLISASSVPCDRENGSVWYAFLPYLYFSVQMFTRLVSTGNAERALTLDIHSKDMDVTRTLHLSKKKAKILIWACALKPRKIVFIEAFRVSLPIEA